MSGFLLDTSALLALRDNAQGANRISELLSDGSPCYGSFMTLMEVFYEFGKMKVKLPDAKRMQTVVL